MAFRFRLSALLQQRRYVLENAKSQLAAAQQAYRVALGQLEQLKEAIRSCSSRFEQAQARGMDVADYLSFRDYLVLLERRVPPAEQELQKRRVQVDKAKRVVVECEKKVKVLEKLEEKDLIEYTKIELTREQKHLDETATLKDYRDKKNDGSQQGQDGKTL